MAAVLLVKAILCIQKCEYNLKIILSFPVRTPQPGTVQENFFIRQATRLILLRIFYMKVIDKTETHLIHSITGICAVCKAVFFNEFLLCNNTCNSYCCCGNDTGKPCSQVRESKSADNRGDNTVKAFN